MARRLAKHPAAFDLFRSDILLELVHDLFKAEAAGFLARRIGFKR
jgi:hypothetical protein